MYYQKRISEVMKACETSENGLSHEEIIKRHQQFGYNILDEKKKENPFMIFLKQFQDLLVIILIIAAIISGMSGQIESTIVIVSVIIVNAILGTIQTLKAEKSLDSLKKLSVPKAKVIREGSFIIKRLPVRFTYDDNYFNALYQGIPNGGYTAMVEKMLDGTEVRLNVDYLADRENLNALAEKVVYTGPVDAYFGYKLGALQYRSVRFETEVLDTDNYQGNAVVNYTDAETPYTRIIEHKHFEFGTQPKTVISREYSAEWKKGDEPYYPVNDEKNGALYAEYKKLADAEPDVIFGGRLGEYKYYDMDKVIEVALDVAAKELK